MAYMELQNEHWASLEAFLQPLSELCELYVEGEDKDHNTPPHFSNLYKLAHCFQLLN